MNLQHLIAQGEHQQQDFKFEITSACKIARTLSAFANTDGGRLLIGVKDNGAIAGVRSDEEMYMVDETRTVVIAEVDPAMQRPVCARLEDGSCRAFIRIADENIVASPVRIALWRSESAPGGALLPLTDDEFTLLHLLRQSSNPSPLTSHSSPLTLNQFCRRAHVPRYRAVRLLATFIRFGLVEEEFQNHTFAYRAI